MNTWYKSLFIVFTLKKGLGVCGSKWTLIHPSVALGLFKHFLQLQVLICAKEWALGKRCHDINVWESVVL